MRVAIVQSNYIPWRGYFELIERVDEFIIMDDVQFTRRDWRNRNRIRTPAGETWLTIPVKQSGNYQAKINEMVVSDPVWMHWHFESLRMAYGKSKYWEEYQNELYLTYMDVPDDLSGINRKLIELGCKWLNIKTPIKTYPGEGTKSDRLIGLCRQAGATRYLSGPTAKAYLDEEAFNQAGIEVDWMEYQDWPKLTFLHGVFNGPRAR